MERRLAHRCNIFIGFAERIAIAAVRQPVIVGHGLFQTCRIDAALACQRGQCGGFLGPQQHGGQCGIALERQNRLAARLSFGLAELLVVQHDPAHAVILLHHRHADRRAVEHLVDVALALAVDDHPLRPGYRRVDEAPGAGVMQARDRTPDTLPQPNAATVIAGRAERHALQIFRRIMCDHVPVEDEAARRQAHATPRKDQTLDANALLQFLRLGEQPGGTAREQASERHGWRQAQHDGARLPDQCCVALPFLGISGYLDRADADNTARSIHDELPHLRGAQALNARPVRRSAKRIVQTLAIAHRRIELIDKGAMPPCRRLGHRLVIRGEAVVGMIKRIVGMRVARLLGIEPPFEPDTMAGEPARRLCAGVAEALQGIVTHDALRFQLQIAEHIFRRILHSRFLLRRCTAAAVEDAAVDAGSAATLRAVDGQHGETLLPRLQRC